MKKSKKIFSKSKINKEFIKKLEDKNITTVSFDIFDTLFFRKCGAPENIFSIIGNKKKIKKIYLDGDVFLHYRKSAEKKAIQNKTSEEIALKDIYSYYPGTKDLRDQLYDLEIEIEKNNLTLNFQVYEWIKLAKKYNKKVILISDMYLTEKEINIVALDKIPNIKLIDEVYVSSDIGLRKSTGNLYQYILDKLNITCANQLHIGDNQGSDINTAKAIGINTLYYNYGKNFQETLDNEKLYLKEHFIEKDNLRLLSFLSNPYQNKEESFYYELGGCIFGPLLFEFSIWLNKATKAMKIEKLNFFMREGYTFEKVYKLIYPDALSDIVKISRDSTNFLITDPNDLGKVNINKSKDFKVKDIYKILNLEIKDNEIHNIKDEPFNSSKLQKYILEDLAQRNNDLEEVINNQQTALEMYFKALRINSSSTFVDFGGGGTVFNRLNTIFFKNKQPKTDLLFFTHNKAYSNTENSTTLSFLPYNKTTEKALSSIHRTPYFIETLLNGYNFSTERFNLKNNNFETIDKKLDFYDDKFRNKLEAFLKGISNFVILAKENHGVKERYDRNYLTLLLARIISLPTQDEVKELGGFLYDEGKGTDEIYPLINFNKNSEADLKNLYLEYINNPFKRKNQYPWLEGFITIKSPNLIKNFYGSSLNQNQARVNSILEFIDENKIKSVSIYAAGEIFELLLPSLVDRKVKIKNVFDSRAKIKPFDYLGYKVEEVNRDALTKNDILIIASVVFYKDIKKQLLQNKIEVDII